MSRWTSPARALGTRTAKAKPPTIAAAQHASAPGQPREDIAPPAPEQTRHDRLHEANDNSNEGDHTDDHTHNYLAHASWSS